MTNKPQQPQQPRPLITITDNLILFVLIALIAVRCQMNEFFPTGLLNLGPKSVGIAAAEISTMLIFAGIIFALGSIWLLVRIKEKSLTWRKTALVAPAALMLIAGIISTCFASNRHTAMIGVINLLSQFLLAILMVQLLNTSLKQRILLTAVAATGVTMGYQCWDQAYHSNPETLRQYQENPEAMLRQMGIEPGTYGAWQYEGRIKSQDTGGYFAISNTAAAFFILSIMATGVMAVGLFPGKSKFTTDHLPPIIIIALALAAQITGMFVTKSKGGIMAWIAGLFLLALLWLTRKFLARHWRKVIISVVILSALAVSVIAIYGTRHNRLPSNSMWVRWQYWQASASMIADHPITGVGSENFGSYYPFYMDGGAPEVVKDPHSFPIALLSQWGIFGLAAFIWAMLAVSTFLARPPKPDKNKLQTDLPTDQKTDPPKTSTPTTQQCWLLAGGLAIAIMMIRIIISDLSVAGPRAIPGVIITLFIIPAAIWFGTFLFLLTTTTPPPDNQNNTPSPLPLLILGCGLLGFLLHNTIDFAIFQPGVGTLFFAIAAAAIAIKHNYNPTDHIDVITHIHLRSALTAGSVVATIALFALVVIPVSRSQSLIKQAQQNGSYLDQAIPFAQRATAANPKDPDGHYLTGHLNYLKWIISDPPPKELLQEATTCIKQAADRDRANARYWRKLTDIYMVAYERTKQQEYLEKAYGTAQEALQRYPVKSELLIQFAEICLKLHKNEEARDALQKAIQIEEDFDRQQKQMYPNQPDLPPRLDPKIKESVLKELKKISETIGYKFKTQDS